VEALDLRKGFIKKDFELGPRDVEVCLWIFGRSDDELDGGGGADVHFCIICGGEDGVGFKARCDVGSSGFLGGCGLARGRGDGGGFDFCSLSDVDGGGGGHALCPDLVPQLKGELWERGEGGYRHSDEFMMV
jgi:hypothetical protein